MDQVEEAPDGGRLAGGVGAEEAVDLSTHDCKVQLGDTALRAVELGEALGADRHLVVRVLRTLPPFASSRPLPILAARARGPRVAGCETLPGSVRAARLIRSASQR